MSCSAYLYTKAKASTSNQEYNSNIGKDRPFTPKHQVSTPSKIGMVTTEEGGSSVHEAQNSSIIIPKFIE